MKKKIIIIASFLLVIIAFVGSSYAYLKAEKGSVNNNQLTLGDLDVILLTDISNITIDKAVPVEDSEGLTNSKVTFQIKNNAGIIANYKVSLVDGTTKSTMLNKDVRYQLKRTNEATSETVTMDITNLADTGLIDTGIIETGVTYTYELVMWLDINSNPNGLVFAKNILVEGMQVASLDKSGANYPELLDNMIPVYYDKTSDTEGVWRVADSKNLNETYKWFDYKDFMWANAVTVQEISTNTTLTLSDDTTSNCTGTDGVCTRNDYLNATVGTIIPMEDITTMWVWIPRYKYVIFNGNNGTSEEQLINVVFEHGIDKTGTVTCVDNILTSSTSSSSETCTDATNGSIVNETSTYTHPAFTFGDTEITGFWYAKFEMSTDQDSTCVTSQSTTNCNVTGQNIYIKPDQISLRYINNANSFLNIRNMELFNNVHGFTQDTNATSSSSQTGEIVNDTNDYDIHMQKNMEWGAVTYLAYSEYGKYGNSLYTGTYKRVYKNNWYTKANSVYTYKTGYSGYSYNANYSTSNTVLYNDLTDLGSGKGYKGAGASTTGTIYGIYDMNGGAYDRTMGNMVNSSGNFYSSSAGFSTSPLEKYYDKYSYNSNSNSSQDSVSRGKLGDATKEMTKGFTGSPGSWEGSYRYMPYSSTPWFTRGGSSDGSAYFGLSYSTNNGGGAYNSNSSRPVLVCSREFPWIK